jgi:hypothetical protein
MQISLQEEPAHASTPFSLTPRRRVCDASRDEERRAKEEAEAKVRAREERRKKSALLAKPFHGEGAGRARRGTHGRGVFLRSVVLRLIGTAEGLERGAVERTGPVVPCSLWWC